MPANALARIASRVQFPAGTAGQGPTDRDLIDRFTRDRDEEAFVTLVGRHERLVRSAIARVLPPGPDADDSFQATFLVLLRRAAAVDWRANLGPWLYGVAHRVAVRARDKGLTRVQKERTAGARPCHATPEDISMSEACAALHEELDRLPDRARLPLLLCYLEGRTRDEAAVALGTTVATLKRRLQHGRGVLRARLARRGVTLCVGLLASVAAPPVRGGAARTTAVLAAVRGSPPPRVLALARRATASALPSKAAAALVGLVGSATLAAILVTSDGTHAAGAAPPDTPAASRPPAEVPRAGVTIPVAAAAVTVTGRVVAPDANGVQGPAQAGVTVTVWGAGRRLGATTTAGDGTFRVAVQSPVPSGAVVVATKAGLAPDWARVPADQGLTPVVLLAAAADGTVSGRVTDLEGRPLANLPVDVDRVGRPRAGRPLEDLIRPTPDQDAAWRPDLDWLPGPASGLPPAVRTDADGRFRVAGVGRDRVVQLTARGPNTEHLRVSAVTRPLAAGAERPGPFGLHGETFTIRVGPSRRIAGTVRDARTGAPVPGMRVAELLAGVCETASDQEGRFALAGVRQGARYQLGAWSAGDAPYFDANLSLDDPSGGGTVTADFNVHRGVVVTGRVADSDGRPVAGRVFYHWANDNPHVKEYPDLPRTRLRMSDWGTLDPEGRYRLLAIPGRGALGVCATPEFAFPRLDTHRALNALRVISHPVAPLHAATGVDIDPGNPKTWAHDFALAPGRSRTLEIRRADSTPGGKVLAVGHSGAADGVPLPGDSLRLTGLATDRARAVVLFDQGRTVGAVAAVAGDQEGPVAVTLEKLGSVAGRVVDASGAPAAGARVRVWLVLDPSKFDNLPTEAFGVNGQNFLAPGAWQAFTGRTATTDRGGRFEVRGLLPGQSYRLVAGYDVEARGGELLYQRMGLSVRAGERSDLGDLVERK